MNNAGAAMQASGRLDQAYEWWWKAIRARPTYWDAIVRESIQRLTQMAHSIFEGQFARIPLCQNSKLTQHRIHLGVIFACPGGLLVCPARSIWRRCSAPYPPAPS